MDSAVYVADRKAIGDVFDHASIFRREGIHKQTGSLQSKPMKDTKNISTVDFKALKQLLDSIPEVLFAYLFGSFSAGRTTPLSDIDVALFLKQGVSLLELGRWIARLESALGRNVDVVVLNDLYKKDPALAFDIIARGSLLLVKENKRLREFKEKTFLYYADTSPLRKKTEAAFRSRLETGNFARSPYA